MTRRAVVAASALLLAACPDSTRQKQPEVRRSAGSAPARVRRAHPPPSALAQPAQSARTHHSQSALAQSVQSARAVLAALARAHSVPANFKVLWDPRTGKGDVRQTLPSGDLLRTCFHCGYRGYTGGLVIGSLNGSGYGLYPLRPIRGFRRINVFCAQDESIWDHGEKNEYTYGWSENFGTGKDGKRLEYVRGRILEQGPHRVLLQSENAGGCYRVTKVAYTRAEVRWWIIATRITNRCAHPIRFDLFTGDDPWIGLYRSSDGDVGWTPDRLIRHETALGPGQFVAGGMYDLGNQALGQKEGAFTNQANFFMLDPAVPLPDRTFFANSFAHSRKDINASRPLDNKSLTALNMGWTDRTLRPGQGLTVALAMGLADTGRPGQIPNIPHVTDQDWSAWRRYLKEGNPGSGSERVEFAAERVELNLTDREMTVTGTYWLRNRGRSSAALVITYPILISARRPAPAAITVDDKNIPVRSVGPGRAEGRFPIRVAPQALTRFKIRYRQRHEGRRAVYMVTSARRWPSPITRAVFVVTYPASWRRARISYPVVHTAKSRENVTHLIVRHDFVPDRELEIRW